MDEHGLQEGESHAIGTSTSSHAYVQALTHQPGSLLSSARLLRASAARVSSSPGHRFKANVERRNFELESERPGWEDGFSTAGQGNARDVLMRLEGIHLPGIQAE